MKPRTSTRLMLALASSLLILVSMAPAEALGDAHVRLLHAVPGGPPAQLQVIGGRRLTLGAIGFGQATQYSPAPARRVELALVADGKRIAKASSTFEEGARYTVLASSRGGVNLRVLRDSPAAPARARLRVVHAAPELGAAEMKLGGRSLGELKNGQASRYFDREPGSYRLTAGKPGDGACS